MRVASGSVRVPGSKSITHRAYLLAAASPEPSTVVDPLRSADTDATLGGLHRLGRRFQLDDRTVQFLPSDATPPHEPLDCRNAGTALRLLMPAAAMHSFPVAFTGDASLQGRPNKPLLDAMRSLGARVVGDDTLPITVQGPLQPGAVTLPASVSSQYASGLLLALPQLAGSSTMQLVPPVSSRPYIDLTVEVASAFGLPIMQNGDTYQTPGGGIPRAPVFRVEGDWSTAAFPLVAAAITQGKITVEGLNPESTQGDRAILQHLQDFGCRVTVDDRGVTVEGAPLETPGTIDVSNTPDLFPALAVVAAAARGTTQFVGGSSLRVKESDRIAAMAAGLATLGIDVQEAPDGISITGGTIGAGTVHAFDDHRIHMAFSVAGLISEGNVNVDGEASAAVSYPAFHQDLAQLTEAP